MYLYLLSTAVFIAIGTLLTPVQAGICGGLLLCFSYLCAWYFKHCHGFKVALLLVVGLLYGSVWLQLELRHRLPSAQDKHSAELRLEVLELETQSLFVRVHAQVKTPQAELSAQQLPPLRRVRLNLYNNSGNLALGDIVLTKAVLRSPRNLANGLPFDYEAWVLSQGIDATGYIQSFTVESSAPAPLRQRILQYAMQQQDVQVWPWLAGLVFGEQGAFSSEQWRLAKDTGTLHLLVVSGMHLGLVVLIGLAAWALLVRLWALLAGHSITHLAEWRALFLISLTLVYVWLAGMGVALLRAWLMLAFILVLHNSRLRLNWLTAIAWAALALLLANPLVWLSAGFSYSFAAVAALLVFYQQRQSSWLEGLWRPQWVVFLTLLPLFLYWQQPVSLIQCLANLLAIPWLSLVLMPLSLLILVFPHPELNSLLLWAGDLFWQWLTLVNNIPLSKVVHLPAVVLFIWPLWLLLLRQGIRFLPRALMLALVLGAAFQYQGQVEAKAIMLDVGQGLALIFSSPESTLVYDAGPAMGAFDSGDSIVFPSLTRLGVRQLNTLVVSHGDNDHAGGAQALLANLPVSELMLGHKMERFEQPAALCQERSALWRAYSQQFLYRYLVINENSWNRIAKNTNNQSCVLQLSWYGQRFLLVGDIGKEVEFELIRQYGNELQSDILVLSHHGSKTSSSAAFLKTVQPKEAWISTGFNNRFNHPAPEVLARLQDQGIRWRNTANAGAVWMLSSGQIRQMRQGWQPPWRQK